MNLFFKSKKSFNFPIFLHQKWIWNSFKTLDKNIQTTLGVHHQKNHGSITDNVGGQKEWWPKLVVSDGNIGNKKFSKEKCGDQKRGDQNVGDKKCCNRNVGIEKWMIENVATKKQVTKRWQPKIWQLKAFATKKLTTKTYGNQNLWWPKI